MTKQPAIKHSINDKPYKVAEPNDFPEDMSQCIIAPSGGYMLDLKTDTIIPIKKKFRGETLRDLTAGLMQRYRVQLKQYGFTGAAIELIQKLEDLYPEGAQNV